MEENCCTYDMVVVELIFFLYKTGESMLDATIRPYIVKAVCQETFPFNASVCFDLDKYPEHEDHVQGIAGSYLMYYRLLVNLPAVFLGLFCGAYSDRYGRKLPMLLPSIGSVLGVLLYIPSLMLEEFRIPLILMGASLQGIFGKSSVITMAVNSYVSDITEMEERTKKLGKLLGMNFFGLFAGSLLSGLLQDTTDMLTTFCCIVMVHAAVVLITVIAMNDSITFPSKKVENKGLKGECCDVFKPSNIKDSVMVIFKQRPRNTRVIILILFFTSVLNQTCKVGEMDITVLFVARSPLNWPKSWYGYLLSVDYAVMGSSLFLILPVLTAFFKVSDVALLLIGITCKIIRLIWAGFCRETWMVYVSVVIGAFAGMITSSLRSLLSKSVDEDEAGKIFSLLACGETASKLLGVVIFVNIYSATAAIFPGFAYGLEAFIYLCMFVMICFMYKDIRSAGTVNLLQAFSETPMYGSTTGGYDTKDGRLPIVDELEEQSSFPPPLPATTP
ncbi:lysosomal proton-coupled steroid conjugate and bile acid symporter SLC46A3-like [Argopecten irradians]|uniref:lysosomal proton-coupled steroid conjugate and bile acid symporter SLC46A3-like n=1 Tax=Argopecten irradians TaxID=31199 RepID=UPI0037236A51